MPQNAHPEKAGLHTVLFPHSGLSEEGLGRILSFFEHLTLFLPWHMEEQEEEASRVLAALREGSPPLKGLVEEETVGGLFDDLPPFESSFIEEPHELEQVCEAWFGLFQGGLRKQENVLDRPVIHVEEDLGRENA